MRIALLALLSILSLALQANNRVELVYSDLSFSIPASFTVVGAIDDRQNLLVFRYSDESGKRFLAFADMTDDQTIEYGCAPGVFYTAVFFETGGSDCNQRAISGMQDNFINDRKVATWTQDSYAMAYSDHGKKAFLFIIGEDRGLIRIDSDFLDGESLKRITKNMSRESD